MLRKSLSARLKVIVVNVITFLVLTLILELLIYVALLKPAMIPDFLLDSFRSYYREKDREIIQVTDCAKYDPELFYIMAEGSCRFSNREFETAYSVNSAGLRDDEESLDAPRIIVLGDSYAMGWGVQQDESFPQILEKTSGLKVLNAGVSSYGTARELILLKRLPLDSVQSVVIQYHDNDLPENQSFLENGNSLRIRAEASYDSLKDAIATRRRYYPFKHMYGLAKAFGKTVVQKREEVPSETSEAQAFLRVLKQADLPHHIRLFAVKMDDYDKINNTFAQTLDSLLKLAEYSHLDLYPIKLAENLEKEDYFRLDDHINARGHAKVAAKIRDQILSVSP